MALPNDDVSYELFNRLPTNQLPTTEGEGERYVNTMFSRVEVVSFKQLSESPPDLNRCQHLQEPNLQQMLVVVVSESEQLSYYKLRRVISAANIDWRLLCREIGLQIKHLTIDGPVKSRKRIEYLIEVSNNLQFVYLKAMAKAKLFYFDLLQNRHLDVSLEFPDPVNTWQTDPVFEWQMNSDQLAFISRAKNLSISYACLQLVVKHYPTFANLNRLKVKYPNTNYAELNEYFDLIDKPVSGVKYPALQHLVLSSTSPRVDTSKTINHLNSYDFTGLKSLTIYLDDDLLTALADKLKNLEKLVFSSKGDMFPTDSLLLLNRLDGLHVIHEVSSVDHLPSVVRLFEVFVKMDQLKRFRFDLKASYVAYRLKPMSGDLQTQLSQALARLRLALPFGEIDPLLEKWLDLKPVNLILKC